MNRTISTAVLALPLAVALTLGTTAAAHAAEGHGQLPAHGGVLQPLPVPPGPGDIATPEDDPEPPVGPDEFANPEPQPEPPAPQPGPPAPQPPAPQPPADEPAEPAEEETDDLEESVEDEEVVEDETLDEDDADSTATASAQNGFLQGLPLVGVIATALALAAAVVAVLLARRARKRSA